MTLLAQGTFSSLLVKAAQHPLVGAGEEVRKIFFS